MNGSRQKGREIEKTRKVMERLEGRIAEAWKDGRRGGRFRVIRMAPGFRVRGGSTADGEN